MARGYSSEEIMAMQRDAIRRVNEMRRISEEKLRQSGMAAPPPPQRRIEEAPPERKSEPPQKKGEPPKPPKPTIPAPMPQSGGLGDLLRMFGSDQETLLLLALLFILIREGADSALILALFYILL